MRDGVNFGEINEYKRSEYKSWFYEREDFR